MYDDKESWKDSVPDEEMVLQKEIQLKNGLCNVLVHSTKEKSWADNHMFLWEEDFERSSLALDPLWWRCIGKVIMQRVAPHVFIFTYVFKNLN